MYRHAGGCSIILTRVPRTSKCSLIPGNYQVGKYTPWQRVPDCRPTLLAPPTCCMSLDDWSKLLHPGGLLLLLWALPPTVKSSKNQSSVPGPLLGIEPHAYNGRAGLPGPHVWSDPWRRNLVLKTVLSNVQTHSGAMEIHSKTGNTNVLRTGILQNILHKRIHNTSDKTHCLSLSVYRCYSLSRTDCRCGTHQESEVRQSSIFRILRCIGVASVSYS